MITIVNGVRIYYEKGGVGKPILLLHGWGNDSDTMRPIFNELKVLGFQVFMIDFPGFGLSDFPPTPWGVDDYVDVVLNLISIFQLEKTSILGHSFGGRVGIKLTSSHPELVEKLILVDSAGIKPKHPLGHLLKAGWVKLLRLFTRLSPRFLKIYLERYIFNLGSKDYRNAGKLRGTFIRVVNEDLKKYLIGISRPVLLIWGELDQETPVSDGVFMNKIIPDSRLIIIKDAGHHSFNHNLKEFVGLINQFLCDKEAASLAIK